MGETRRVEMWRGGCRSNISVAAPFVWRCLTGSAVAPFPHRVMVAALSVAGAPGAAHGRSGDDDRNGDRYQLRLLGTGLLLGDVSLAVRGGVLGIAAPAARPPTTKKYRFALAASSICIVSRDPADLPLATFPVRTVAPSDRGSDPVGMQESGMPGSGTSTFIDSEGAAAHWRPAFRHLRVSPQMWRQAH